MFARALSLTIKFQTCQWLKKPRQYNMVGGNNKVFSKMQYILEILYV